MVRQPQNEKTCSRLNTKKLRAQQHDYACPRLSYNHLLTRIRQTTDDRLPVHGKPKLICHVFQHNHILPSRHVEGVHLRAPPIYERANQRLIQLEPMPIKASKWYTKHTSDGLHKYEQVTWATLSRWYITSTAAVAAVACSSSSMGYHFFNPPLESLYAISLFSQLKLNKMSQMGTMKAYRGPQLLFSPFSASVFRHLLSTITYFISSRRSEYFAPNLVAGNLPTRRQKPSVPGWALPPSRRDLGRWICGADQRLQPLNLQSYPTHFSTHMRPATLTRVFFAQLGFDPLSNRVDSR
ncbi:hypothetical protein PIB30_076187 [Stylosanthes scabra]|uniref:Uncharacterized protein n=1 Tax=Stylosanthes scabra TaxID=79078 RepID=A0ABU6YP75_9FABA|nr:hypothetical protein [Stylosanthes scabra]